jgi:hypothetical protein
MPRPLRIAVGEMVYHVHNRANGRMQIFARDSDYEAFEQVLIEARERISMRVLACCLMPSAGMPITGPSALVTFIKGVSKRLLSKQMIIF